MILANLSAFLLHVEVNGSKEMVTAAKTIVEGVSSILEYTYMVSLGSFCPLLHISCPFQTFNFVHFVGILYNFVGNYRAHIYFN